MVRQNIKILINCHKKICAPLLSKMNNKQKITNTFHARRELKRDKSAMSKEKLMSGVISMNMASLILVGKMKK